MKKIITLTLALILAFTLAACGGNGGGGLGDIVVLGDSSTPGTSNIPAPTNSGGDTTTQKPTDPPTGNVDPKLIGTWTMGDSTLQVRKILTGKYDIRGIGFSGITATGISYTFYENGTYMKIVLGRTNLIIVEGKYSVSNNTIRLSNNTSKSTTKDDVPIVWESTSNPADESHSFEIVFRDSLNLDILYLDGINSEPAVGYWRSEDVDGGTTTAPAQPATPGGSIDPKLLGQWWYQGGASFYYEFDANGNFELLYTRANNISGVTGKYSIANGNIYLTELIYEDHGGGTTNLQNQQYTYSFGNDEKGEYLFTVQFSRDDLPPNTEAVKFRRVS